MRARLIERARESACQRLGREPTRDELAEAAGIEAGEFERRALQSLASEPIPLALLEFESDSGRVGSAAPAERGPTAAGRAARQQLLNRVMRGMSRPERLVVLLYYFNGLTMKEIGETIGLSESRVSQLHSALMVRLAGQLDREDCFAALSHL